LWVNVFAGLSLFVDPHMGAARTFPGPQVQRWRVTTQMPEAVARSTHGPAINAYQVFILTLCIWGLAILAAGTFLELSDSTRTILDYADNTVCVLFLIDFVHSLFTAPRKLHYLLTSGWIDLLSSIPTIDALRWGRAARVMRILRVARGVKSARLIAHYVVRRRAESAFLAATLLSLLLIMCASIAILHFEVPAGGNIRTAQDAMWWAISTMTTAGYGDGYPVTPEGRVVAVFLMCAGVAVFGTFSGLVASWFLSSSTLESDSDMAEIKAMLKDLQARIDTDQSARVA
jgi:voltage-gated potassium channel